MEFASLGLWAASSILACLTAVVCLHTTRKLHHLSEGKHGGLVPRFLAGITLLACFGNLYAASSWLLPVVASTSATATENVRLKLQIEEMKATSPPAVVQARPAPMVVPPDDEPAKRKLLLASNAARVFIAGRAQEWIAPTMPGPDAQQAPDAAIDHAIRTLEGLTSLRTVDSHLDEFLAALHRLRSLQGEPRLIGARSEKVAAVSEHLRQLQEAATRLVAEQQLSRNSIPDYRATDTYTILRLPQPEYRRGIRGTYYLVNFSQAIFARSKYVLDSGASELVKRAAQQFATDVLNRIPATRRATIFIRGTADDTTWSGAFVAGREYRRLDIFAGDLLKGYASDSETVLLTPPLPNRYLPDLRAAYLRDILSSTAGFENTQILKGYYCQRQAELIVHVD